MFDPVAATPGRLNDLLMNEYLNLKSVTYLVGVLEKDESGHVLLLFTRCWTRLIVCWTWDLNLRLRKFC